MALGSYDGQGGRACLAELHNVASLGHRRTQRLAVMPLPARAPQLVSSGYGRSPCAPESCNLSSARTTAGAARDLTNATAPGPAGTGSARRGRRHLREEGDGLEFGLGELLCVLTKRTHQCFFYGARRVFYA